MAELPCDPKAQGFLPRLLTWAASLDPYRWQRSGTDGGMHSQGDDTTASAWRSNRTIGMLWMLSLSRSEPSKTNEKGIGPRTPTYVCIVQHHELVASAGGECPVSNPWERGMLDGCCVLAVAPRVLCHPPIRIVYDGFGHLFRYAVQDFPDGYRAAKLVPIGVIQGVVCWEYCLRSQDADACRSTVMVGMCYGYMSITLYLPTYLESVLGTPTPGRQRGAIAWSIVFLV